MVGPVAQVLFAGGRVPGWRGIIAEVVSLVSQGLDGNSLQVMSTLPIGGSYRPDGYGRPFLLDIDSELPWGMAEEDSPQASPSYYEQPFGVIPDHDVHLSAMSNDPSDHRVLGELALMLAERLGGVIDLVGLITPKGVNHWDLWSDARPVVEAFTDTMAGKALAIPSDRDWASHTVDTTFLRSWMAHPEFHMIK